MAFQFSTAVRNAAADAIHSTIGSAPVLELWSDPVPDTPADPDTGTCLATMFA